MYKEAMMILVLLLLFALATTNYAFDPNMLNYLLLILCALTWCCVFLFHVADKELKDQERKRKLKELQKKREEALRKFEQEKKERKERHNHVKSIFLRKQ